MERPGDVVPDVLEEGVLRALSELDCEAVASLSATKLPALRRALKKEYSLTEQDVEVVLQMKKKQSDWKGTVRVRGEGGGSHSQTTRGRSSSKRSSSLLPEGEKSTASKQKEEQSSDTATNSEKAITTTTTTTGLKAEEQLGAVEKYVKQTELLFKCFIAESCTCSEMTAGPDYSYLWADGDKVKQPVSLPAKQYIEALFLWIHSLVETFSLPSSDPMDSKVLKNIFKRLFRVYAHIYHHHFEEVVAMHSETTLMEAYKQFHKFVSTHGLCSEIDLKPLKDLHQTF